MVVGDGSPHSVLKINEFFYIGFDMDLTCMHFYEY